MLKLGDTFPDIKAPSTMGNIQLHEWLGDSWGIFFSHPNAFTPVCTTELARVGTLHQEFIQKNVKVIGYACDGVPTTEHWTADIKAIGHLDTVKLPYPIIGDETRSIAVTLGMLDPDEKGADGLPVTCRSVFIIDPKKKMRLSLLYPANVGRNFDEILRVVEALQLSDKHPVATPADWKPGDRCMVQPSLSDYDANQMFHQVLIKEVPSKKNYMRYVHVAPM